MEKAENIKEYYQNGKLRILFEHERELYQIEINKLKYPLLNSAYHYISKSKGEFLVDKLKSYNEGILQSLRQNNIPISELEKAFSIVREKEWRELGEFLEADKLKR